MHTYIYVIRGTPLLLQLLFFCFGHQAIGLNRLLASSVTINPSGIDKMSVMKNKMTVIMKPMLEGAQMTVILFFITLILSIPLGFIVTLLANQILPNDRQHRQTKTKEQ
jgi:ABC-type amino acid transport system permease subunit